MKLGKKSLYLLMALLVTGVTIFGGDPVRSENQDESFATGALPLTREQYDWLEKNAIKTTKVELNELGLARINKARKEKGLPEYSGIKVKRTGEAVIPLAPDEATGAGTLGTEALPSAIDNSTLKYFPPIRSQGSLGSCQSFATTYYTFTHMTAFARNWDVKDNAVNTNKFSPKFVYNMINRGLNEGAMNTEAINLLLKHGAPTWASFPYDSDYTSWATTASLWREAINYRADQTGIIQNIDTTTSLDSLKQLLNDGYILNYNTWVSSWQLRAIKNNPNSTVDDPYVGKNAVYYVNGQSGGHTMTLVGYNDAIWVDINNNNILDSGELGALRIANSWGTSYEDAGFCWVAYDALKSTSAVSGGPSSGRQPAFWDKTVYWLTGKPAYIPRLVGEFSVSHNQRNQMNIDLGYSGTSVTTPAATWNAYAVSNMGGALSFNGTIVFDFTDLINQYGLDNGTQWRWYTKLVDSTSDSYAGTINSLKVIDGISGVLTLSSNSFPATFNGSTVYRWVDYRLGNATPSPTPTPGGVDRCTGGTVTASGENPPNEDKTKAFDDSTSTKWLTFSSSGWIQYDFAGTTAYAINKYTITSANDYATRDPKNWTFKGSNNGTSWTTVDTRTNVTFSSRFQKQTFTFTNTTAYQMYRLDISANNGDTALQLAEIEMFDNGTAPTATPTPAPTPTPAATATPTPGGIVSGATYKVMAKCSGKLMEVNGGSTADGANVQQWTDNGGNNQKWRIDNMGSGYYKFTNINSGKVLDVAGSSTADGANVQQWSDNGSTAQRWRIDDMGAGYYKLTAQCSGKVLDVNGSSTADGANIQQWSDNGSDAQRWRLTQQ